ARLDDRRRVSAVEIAVENCAVRRLQDRHAGPRAANDDALVQLDRDAGLLNAERAGAEQDELAGWARTHRAGVDRRLDLRRVIRGSADRRECRAALRRRRRNAADAEKAGSRPVGVEVAIGWQKRS